MLSSGLSTLDMLPLCPMVPCLQAALQQLTAGSLGQKIMPLHQHLHAACLAYRRMLHQGQGSHHSHVIGKQRSTPYAFSKHPLMLRCHAQDAHPLYILNIAKIFNNARGGPTELQVRPSKHFCILHHLSGTQLCK